MTLQSALPLYRTSETSQQPIEGEAFQTTTHSRRPWTINGDFVTLQPQGVARYAREVTVALDELMSEEHPLTHGLDIEILAPRPPSQSLELKRIGFRILPEFNKPRLPQLWVQMQLPRHVEGGLISFCNLGPVRVPRHIVCIHDLQTRLVPESYSLPFRLAHHLILPMLGRRAEYVTTVSGLSSNLLTQYKVVPAEKIVVTYNGADHASRWREDSGEVNFNFNRPFALCIGRRESHKNIDLLLRLAEPLDRLGVDLVMVGSLEPAFLEQSGHAKAKNLHRVGRVSDNDLAALLSRALCFLLPSRMEGFGLPAVEAMVRGCPVVASTSPCLPEICDAAALLADPDDDDAWVAAVRDLLDNPELRIRLSCAGRNRAAAFSWRKIALTYLSLMQESDRRDKRL